MVVTCADGCCGVGGFSQAIKIVFGPDAVRTVWARDIDPIAAAVFEAKPESSIVTDVIMLTCIAPPESLAALPVKLVL